MTLPRRPIRSVRHRFVRRCLRVAQRRVALVERLAAAAPEGPTLAAVTFPDAWVPTSSPLSAALPEAGMATTSAAMRASAAAKDGRWRNGGLLSPGGRGPD